MSSRSNSSRERILDCAEAIILEKGFSSTSIEDILERASITKGGFFYHFDGKVGLAKALAERYLVQDAEVFGGLFKQAEELSENPLHQLLIFLKLLAETMGQMKQTHPGCLVVSFTYNSNQLNDEVRQLIRKGLIAWREMIGSRIDRIKEVYPLEEDVDTKVLADMFGTTIEGGIVISRAFQDNAILINQILSYRNYLRTLFER